jgi:hypothetical protein
LGEIIKPDPILIGFGQNSELIRREPSQTKLAMDALSNSLPVLRAPNAAECLNGLSPKEVFRNYVLDDPEVVVLGKRVVKAKSSHAAVFRDGMFPGPMTSHFFFGRWK